MSDSDRTMIHIRLPRELVARIDHEAVDRELDRSRMVESLVQLGLSYTRPAPVRHGVGNGTDATSTVRAIEPAYDPDELPLD